jgi:hypothetical protein
MTKAEGFERMDVATDIHLDPKFRHLARLQPEAFPVAFTAYVAILAESWREAERLLMIEAWPTILPYDPEVVAVMQTVRLLDEETRIPASTWDVWFTRVVERRTAYRDRWNRANTARSPRGNSEETAREPRDDRASTANPVPFRSVPSDPSVPSRAPARGENGSTNNERRPVGFDPSRVIDPHDLTLEEEKAATLASLERQLGGKR